MGVNDMTNEAREQLKSVKHSLVISIPEAIVKELVGKGLTFAQAEAMLERAKDLLRDVII